VYECHHIPNNFGHTKESNEKLKYLSGYSMTRSRHLSTHIPQSSFKLGKGKLRRRSLSDMFGIGWQSLKTNTFQEHSNQAASRTLVGAGYSKFFNSIQENGLNNTTLQTAILTLVEDLNYSSETINYVKEELTKPSAIMPMKENILKEKGKSLDKEETTKLGATQPLLGLQYKKKQSFNLSDYEGMQEKFAETPWYFSSSSLFIFSKDNVFRKVLVICVESLWYGRFIMCCCILSVVVSIQTNTIGVVTPIQLATFDYVLFAVSTPHPQLYIFLSTYNQVTTLHKVQIWLEYYIYHHHHHLLKN
jgi:hypothetical protein